MISVAGYAETFKQKDLWKSVESGVTYPMYYFKGVDANIQNEEGDTPLIVAVKKGHVAAIRELNEAIVDVTMEGAEGKTAFEYTKDEFGNVKNRRLYGALRVLEVAQVVRGKAKLVEYAYKNTTDRLQFTIDGAHCEAFWFPKNSVCSTVPSKPKKSHPIFTAIRDHNATLFDRDFPSVDIDLQNRSGYSMLWYAIIKSNYDVIDKVLQRGIDINQADPNDLHTPIRWSMLQDDVVLLKLLINHGVDPNARDKFGTPALFTGMQKCKNIESVTLLLESGANPHIKDRQGKTVLEQWTPPCEEMRELLERYSR